MRFADYLRLAFRNVRRARVRSALTVGAIVIGATGITIMLTFVTSVKHYVVQKFERTGQEREIQAARQADLAFSTSGEARGKGGTGGPNQPAPLTDELEAQIRRIPGVAGVAAIANTMSQPPFEYVTVNQRKLDASRLVGYEPNGVIPSSIVAGAPLTQPAGAVMLTSDFAKAAGLTPEQLVGQNVVFHTSPGYTGVGASLPDTLPPQNQCGPGANRCFGGPTSGLPAIDIPAKVVAVLGGGDQGEIVVPIPWLFDLVNQSQPRGIEYPPEPNRRPGENRPPSGPARVVGGWTKPSNTQFVAERGGYESFVVMATAVRDVKPVAAQLETMGLHTATGLAELEDQKKAANAIGLVLGALGLIALFIAALGIMNTMVMSVLERTREIGVMRAVGARRATIRRLFTFEAGVLGFLGGVIGVGIGTVFVVVAKKVIRDAVASGDITKTNFSVPVWLMVVVIAGTTAIGVLSGLFPSRRAARLDPVEALRHE